jgi:hypothetical protein
LPSSSLGSRRRLHQPVRLQHSQYTWAHYKISTHVKWHSDVNRTRSYVICYSDL